MPAVAVASVYAPPSLPAGDPAPTDAPPAATQPATPPQPGQADPPQPTTTEGPTATEPAPGLEASGTAGAEVSGSGADVDLGAAGRAGSGTAEDEGSGKGEPGMVRGRREHVMNTNRGSVGLFRTSLPDAGGRYTFRFRVHTDFFRKDTFIFEGQDGEGDRHSRVRGGVTVGFSPLEYLELFFSVNSQANRNARDQQGRQDEEAIFALGDIDFGAKGAYRFKKGFGIGAQLGLGLLSGSERLRTDGVNFWFDTLFALDIRYLTKRQFPFRITANIGWILDNTLKLADFENEITDATSREVTRFAIGANHNRVRMRYAIDFPIRVGKEKQYGIDPILEWAWDVSTQEEDIFAQPGATDSPLRRGSQWLTLGLRANVVSGLHIDAGVDIGLVSPNFEFGPPVPPWQVILGLGWSFDPKPVVKEVEVESKEPVAPPTPDSTDGRLVGQVTGPDGQPIPDAKIIFPGLTPNAILTDQSGAFTSYRFPAGNVPIQVEVGGQMVYEGSAEVVAGEDTNVPIQLEQPPTPPTGVVQGSFVDGSGNPVAVSMRVSGQGVDEAFPANEAGLLALELFAGEYRATLTAPGFKAKDVTFTVPENGEVTVRETLERDAPPSTPNVVARGKTIRLKKKIRYKGNDVSTRSHAVLDELAAFLNHHSEYQLIEIGVHTDDRGAAQKRSAARAESVKNYLISKGVAPTRVEAKGYGSSKPIAVNMTASGRAKNNRTAIRAKQMQ